MVQDIFLFHGENKMSDLQLVYVYKTSQGFFGDRENAEKSCQKISDTCNMLEHIEEVPVLQAHGKYFALCEMAVK